MDINYRFSGNETFQCRYAWLPKAYNALVNDPDLFEDDEKAMIALGVGKNMVSSIRFWVQVTGIAQKSSKNTFKISDFGRDLLASNGFDPFLEDIRTLWLIHWKLSSNVNEPIFAWDYLLNRWQHPELSKSTILMAFMQETEKLGKKLAKATLEQHYNSFMHTYLPTRSRKGDVQEDNLDSPLVELELINVIGERRIDNDGKRESLYAFRREEKPEITPDLFIYFVDDFWRRRKSAEKTITFRDIAVSHGSPGQILKLPEIAIRDRLESIEKDSRGVFAYKESTTMQQLIRKKDDVKYPLSYIYENDTAYAEQSYF